MKFRDVRRRGGLLIAIAVLMFTLVPMPLVQAAEPAREGFNLTLSPLPISLVTKPGQSVSTPIRVQNTGTQAVRLKVSLMKFSAKGTAGEPAIAEPTAQDTYTKWVSFSKTSFVAQPGVFNEVTMTIKPPKEAAFGYYYAVVFSQDNGDQPAVPNQNKVNGAVASLVLLDVQAPGERRQLEVASFKSAKKVYQYLPAEFNILVKNPGNIHVMPSGNIFIKRAGGKDFIGTLSINAEQGTILPNSSRQFTATWNDGFPSYEIKRQNGQIVSDKRGKPIRELNWDLKNASKLRIGHYTASMTLVYNDGQRDVPIEGEVSFWVIPWVPFFIMLFILILFGVGIFVIIRSVVRRAKGLRKKKPNATD